MSNSISDIHDKHLGTMEHTVKLEDEQPDTEAEKRTDAFRRRTLLRKAFRSLRNATLPMEKTEAAAEETEEGEVVYEATKKLQTNEVSWFQQISKRIEEENLVVSYFDEEDVFRFRIEHNHAQRPLIGAVFKTRTGDELVSLNELTIPLDRFLSMSECWNSSEIQRVVMICDQNYVLENTTGQQIREAFIFLHKRQAEEDREDDATMCAVLAMIIIIVGVLLALGVYLRFMGDHMRLV